MISINDTIAALNAFKEAVRENTVPTTTLAERLAVCNACPMNQKNSGVKNRVSQILGQLATKHSVPAEISDRSCGVCGCNFSLLLPALPENLHKDSPEEAAKRPESCWFNAKA